MHLRPVALSFGALLLAAFGLVSAQNAYTTRPKHVRAGPNQDYPLVAQLDAGAPLEVHGCLSDWSWCDVSFDDNSARGWVFSDGVSFVYQGGRVPLYSYAPSLGITVITFSLGSYWGDYYRGRPWYSQRDQWEHRRLPEHTRPAGRPHEGPPPARNASGPPTRHERPHPSERPQPSEHPRPMSHASPLPPPRERAPVSGHEESRSEERRSSTPSGRGAQQPQRTRPPQSGHPSSAHAKPAHDEHEKQHPPQGPR
jgi:uncharacterized protein YraI